MVTNIDRKWRSKWHQQVIKIEALGVQGSFFEICLDFAKFVFLVLIRSAERRAEIMNKSTFVRQDGPENSTFDAIYNPAGPLYWQILARLYIH